ncbi:16503_t:CDS:2, partial [Funneliformis mosseae]
DQSNQIEQKPNEKTDRPEMNIHQFVNASYILNKNAIMQNHIYPPPFPPEIRIINRGYLGYYLGTLIISNFNSKTTNDKHECLGSAHKKSEYDILM